MTQHANKMATIYRMVMPDHICPFGLKARDLLKRRGYAIDDHWLKTRAETDAFKAEHGVKTTPQIFIDGARIGGYDDLRRFFGLKVKDPEAVSYQPVVAVFAVSALLALAISLAVNGLLFTTQTAEWFVAIAMSVLALLKLQDVERFSTMFLGYDLLARRYVPYSYVYPFAELFAGISMIAGIFLWASLPIAAFIGGVGAYSVFKAVYVEKRQLKCACVGGSSKVPLGFVSLTENIMMVAMAVWMTVRMA
jgi:glutaredoxin